jgi:metal-responsive CopG/Arc/MetJ family transcriptional regulator
MAVYKVNISLAPTLVEEIDAAAKELGLTRSGFVAEASARYVADVKNLSAEERRRRDIDRALATFQRVGAKLSEQDIQDMIDQTRRDRERDMPDGWTAE